MGLLSADLIALFVAMHLLSLGDRQTTGSSGDYERTEQQDGTNGYHETISGVGSRKTCLPSEDAAYTTLKLALSACEQYVHRQSSA